MGMYTELNFNVELKEDVPSHVVEALRYMTTTEGRPHQVPTMPEHPLFGTTRWSWMLSCDSYYSMFEFDDISNAWYLSVRCNLKNYDQEIEKFIDWIMPYVHADPGDFLGVFYRYEDPEEPTLIRKV